MFLKNIKVTSFYSKKIILSQNSLLKIPRRNGYLILYVHISYRYFIHNKNYTILLFLYKFFMYNFFYIIFLILKLKTY